MTVDVWVENHQPVALAPLVDLPVRRGGLVYIGRRVAADGWDDVHDEGTDVTGEFDALRRCQGADIVRAIDTSKD